MFELGALMRQILLSVVFVLSGVAQVNAHHTDRESFGELYTEDDTISRFFGANLSEFYKPCDVSSFVELLRNILNGVPSDVSLHLFSKSYEGAGLFSDKDVHASIYARFLNQLHLSEQGQSKSTQKAYDSLSNVYDSSGNRIYMTKAEKDIIVTTFFACGLTGQFGSSE